MPPDQQPHDHDPAPDRGVPSDPSAVDAVEARRLAAVRATGLLGVVPGDRLDRIARRAAEVAGAPVAMVSLVDEHTQWAPGAFGDAAPRELPRGLSFCAASLDSTEPFIVPDASKDPDWAHMPFVEGDPGVRFYAGQPIDDGHGNILGSVCVLDVVPREADDRLLRSLSDLAIWARHELTSPNAGPVPDGGSPQAAPAAGETDGAAAPSMGTDAEGQDAGAAPGDASGDSVSDDRPDPRRHTAGPAPAGTASSDDERSSDRLHELERLQALVVSTTAHELRTPLTVLRVHADMLLATADDLGPDELASLQAISRAVARLEAVSDGLVSELRESAEGAEEALRRWLHLEEGSERIRPGVDE